MEGAFGAADGGPEDLPDEVLVGEAAARGREGEAALRGDVAVRVHVDHEGVAAPVHAQVDAAVVAEAEHLEGPAPDGSEAARLVGAQHGGDRGGGGVFLARVAPFGGPREDARGAEARAGEGDLAEGEHARDGAAEQRHGELATVDEALHERGLPARLDHEGDAIAERAAIEDDGGVLDAARAVLALGLDDHGERDVGDVIGAVGADCGGDRDARAAEDPGGLVFVEAMAQREVRASREGESEPLQHPGDGDLEATVVVERFAEVEDHLRAVIADRRSHLARAEHAAMDDLHAGRSGESGADGRGGGLGAVFSHAGERGRDVTAGRLSGVARERLTEIARGGWREILRAWLVIRRADALHPREEWRLVGASSGILVGEEQDPCRCHAGTEGFADSPLFARAILGGIHDFERSPRRARQARRRGRKGHEASGRRHPRDAARAGRSSARAGRLDSTRLDLMPSTRGHDWAREGGSRTGDLEEGFLLESDSLERGSLEGSAESARAVFSDGSRQECPRPGRPVPPPREGLSGGRRGGASTSLARSKGFC